MKADDSERYLVRATWALMLTPLLLLIVFLTLMAHAWIGLGHLPEPMVEGYQTTAFHAHQLAVIWLGCFAFWGAMPLWLGLLCVRRFRQSWSWKLPFLQAMTFVLGWVIVAIVAAIDPGQFVSWYLD
jgi:hypothetical protein